MRKLVVLLTLLSGAIVGAQPSAQPSRFTLSVDSIMRGPALVGYPPSDLRWSGDSKELYFEWRLPKEDEAATYVVGRDGGQPRRLTDDERRSAPLTNGSWDRERRRIVGIDRGDVVLIDTVARTRFDITRTTGNETSVRWARNGTHVTFVRDNNVFIVPAGAASNGTLVQLTDIAVRRSTTRLTDSQRVAREEEHKLLDWVEQEAERRQRREARDLARALPKFELTDRQSIADAALSADEAFVYLVVADRAEARAAQVPRYVGESAYTEEISSRNKVGDTQDGRRLAILDLKTGEGHWVGLEGINDPVAIPKPLEGDARLTAPAPAAAPAPKRQVRWGALVPSPDGKQVLASVRAADNVDRWLVLVDPATGKTRVLDTVHDEAWVREIGPSSIGGGLGWLPDSRRVWFLAEHDGWMQLYSVDTSTPARGAQGAHHRAL